ncbi:MAG TPA: hypothetical protein VG246_03950 [Acidimicrobiales bacterium]|nr:hypothetical protein [Acidimicrobiales bacterium]
MDRLVLFYRVRDEPVLGDFKYAVRIIRADVGPSINDGGPVTVLKVLVA